MEKVIQFTKQQYAAARNCSALAYAQRRGYDLVPVGHRFYLREHPSMVFLPNGRWFWNSQGLAGGALEFAQRYEGLSLPEAVVTLANGTYGRQAMVQAISEPEPRPFRLPPKEADNKPLIQYLCDHRKIDLSIVAELLEAGRIYLSRTVCGSVSYLNAVFVGVNHAGVPRSALLRGISSGSTYKGAVAGSDKHSPFCAPSEADADTLAVFEAPIDALSHATVAMMQGKAWRQTQRIALGGNPAPDTLAGYLRQYPNICTVEICFDSDSAGRMLEARLRRELETSRSCHIISSPPPAEKDWNDYLIIKWRRK